MTGDYIHDPLFCRICGEERKGPHVCHGEVNDPLRDPTMDEAYHKSLNIHRSILTEANRLVHEDRSEAYDHPLDNFTRTAKLWQVILEDVLKDGAVLTPEMVGLCMVGVKLAREVHLPKRDNLVDASGYLEAVAWLKHERTRRESSRVSSNVPTSPPVSTSASVTPTVSVAEPSINQLAGISSQEPRSQSDGLKRIYIDNVPGAISGTNTILK
jgi:hypothetical protein